MAWSQLEGDAAEVTCHTDGKIVWNGATHAMLSAPETVALYHDAAANKLGLIKVGRRFPHALAVIVDNSEFYIKAADHLDNGGIEIEEQFSETPQESSAPPEPPGGGSPGIVWIPLPE